MDDAWLSIADLVAYSKLSKRTLYDHFKGADPLPHHKIGGRVLVRRSEFDAWVRRQGDQAATDAPVEDTTSSSASAIVRRMIAKVRS